MYIKELGFGVMDWVELAKDRDMWRALVKAVINLRVCNFLSVFITILLLCPYILFMVFIVRVKSSDV